MLGGVHGNEPEGVVLALGLIHFFSLAYGLSLDLTVVPQFNMDGVLAGSRLNSRGVDLNRNLPTKDWSSQLTSPKYPPGPSAGSEPENHALMAWLEQTRPQMVYSLHSWHPMLNVNGDCLPEAETLKRWLGYKIVQDIGYPTPGCLGTYCGLERHMPTLTYEIERGLSPSAIVRTHMPALVEALKVTEKRFSSW